MAVGVSVVLACTNETSAELILAAEQHIAKHEYRTAQIKLKNAIQLDPSSGAGHRLLGTALLRGGDPVAAETALRKALDLGERADDALPDLAIALIREGQPDRLTRDFGTRRLDDAAADAAFQTTLGQAWFAAGDLRRSGDAFTAALARVRRYPPARLGQARIAAHEGKTSEAVRVVAEVLAADPQLGEAHLLKARLSLSRGQPAEAIEALENAIALDGRDVPARLALVSLLVNERRFDAAQTVLDAAPAPSLASDPRLVYHRALLAVRKGELDKARGEADKILRQLPDHAATLVLASEIELRSNNLKAAEGFAQRAMRSKPDASEPRQLLAAIHLREGRPGKSIDVLQPLLERTDPKDPRLMLLAGEAYLTSGDVGRAAELFESAKSGAASRSAARVRLGQIALAKGDFEQGVEELRAASEEDAEHRQADLLLVAIYLRRHEPWQALASAEALIKKQPSEPIGYVLAGTSHLAAKDLSNARQSFGAALKIQPDHLPALRGMASVDIAEGHADDAKQRYAALIAKRPNDEQLLMALAQLHERVGNMTEAGATLRKAIQVNPRSPMAYGALAQHHLLQRDVKAAVAVAQEALTTNPQHPQLLALLGNAQEANGAPDDAIRTLQELVRIAPQSLSALRMLATVQGKRRDFTGAARSLRQAQRMAPANEGVARDLVAILLAAGKPEDAVAVAKGFKENKSQAAVGQALEGDVHAWRKDWHQGEQSYRRALKANPQSKGTAISLCRVISASGRKSEAAKFARDWLSRNPADVAMRVYVADTALSAGDYRAAAAQYESVVGQEPGHVVALNNLAWTLGKLNDQRAVGFAERAVQLAPDSPAVLDTLGMLHVEHDEANKGVEYLARARALAPDRKDLRLHYAIGLIRAGRAEEGKTHLLDLAASPEDFPGKADIPILLRRL